MLIPADRKRLNMTPPGKLNRRRSSNLLIKSTFLRSFIEPQLLGEALLVPFRKTLDMIDQHEAQLWGE